MEFLSYGKQWIDQNDIDAVVNVLKSDFLTQGPAVSQLEEKLCEVTGAKYAIAVANGTAALHMAVLALEIEKGVEGITSPITFVASANAMIYGGLNPTFADIDPKDYTISPDEIRKRVTDKTKLLIPVHFAGQPAKMKEIAFIAQENNLRVIEDAAHAIGSTYEDGGQVGNCTYSDMTIFSFHPVKTITSAEGGAITTNSKELYEKLLLLRSHGITKDPQKMHGQDATAPWYYEMQSLGFNYRMSDIHAALCYSQLEKLGQFKERRREIVNRYNEAFKVNPLITIPHERTGVDSCFHLYMVQIPFEKLTIDRSELMNKLRKHNVGTQVLYIPVHLQPFYVEQYGYQDGDFPVAEAYYENALALPLYPKLSNEEQAYVISLLESVLEEYSCER